MADFDFLPSLDTDSSSDGKAAVLDAELANQAPSARDLQRSALRDLSTLSTECATTESEIERRRASALDDLNRKHQRALVELDQRYEGLVQSVKEKAQSRVARIEQQFESESVSIKTADRAARQKLTIEKQNVEQKIKQQVDQAVWLAESVFEGAQQKAVVEKKKASEVKDEQTTALDEMEQKLAAQMAIYGLRSAPPQAQPITPPTIPDPADPFYVEQRDATERLLRRFSSLRLAHLGIGATPAILALLLAGAGGGAAQALHKSLDPQWPAIGVGAGAGLVAGIVLWIILKIAGGKQVRQAYVPLAGALQAARLASEAQFTQTMARIDAEYQQSHRQCQWEIKAAKDKYAPVLAKAIKSAESGIIASRDEATRKTAKLQAAVERARGEAEDSLKRHHADVDEKRTAELASVNQQHQAAVAAIEDEYGQGRHGLARRLAEGLAQIQAARGSNGQDDGPFDWSDPRWANWIPPKNFTDSIRIGQLHVDLKKIADSVPRSGPVQLELPPAFDMPVMLGFPRHASLLIQADRAGRVEALRILQNVMMRLLTGLPAGRVRFTIIDPVGLGQNFAGFMRLADYDDALVGGRIYTEGEDIERRMADLTEHMETVIQKYLRNEYENIDEYNAQAGELAEPYRFLVISDFPVGFESESFRRLSSIAASGARCGVYTLILRDTRQALSSEVRFDDLEAHSLNIVQQNDGQFVWKDPVFEKFPLNMDAPPEEQMLTRTLDIVGKYAKEAKRVEVSFDAIAPKFEQFWTGDSKSEMVVPIGRLGATRLQMFRLGRGMAQHTLIAGKTGSGKSTLLHAIITNLAMWYSPDAIELYLIDFKKGVEFKTYAVHALPHARAIAVESDREFGLSVLQRLDAELTRRGDLFRKLGVQDLAAYRATPGAGVMPRTLLVIDEFQEFFSEDDRVGQEAAVLLDRLVRQGRAFGIHVLLGSQTIGGSSGLPRTTIGQMAVRIALQCSEADSQLILGDNNSAARLLTRPGEAIYNDQGGLVEANSPFQIAWLPDERRDIYLDRVQQKLSARPSSFPPPIVFEGNAPANLLKNQQLEKLIEAPGFNRPNALLAYLGDPVAIKEPTVLTFRRQSGANVLIIGQNEDAAMGMMVSSMLTLAAQQPAESLKFYLLDGSASDSPLAGAFAKIKAVLPQETKLVEFRAVPEAVNELAEILADRQANEQPGAASIFFFIFGLQRFRVLRKTEDDFSFSMNTDEEKKPAPGKQFADLLREGPAHGIHIFAWADTPVSIERTLDRTAMREFDNRVLFQMSATDSSNLIDSPTANKLGFHRALAFSEEQGTMEKFRPYAVPDNTFLDAAGEKLAKKA